MSRAGDPNPLRDCLSHQELCSPSANGAPWQNTKHDLNGRMKQRRNKRDLPSSPRSQALMSPAGGVGRDHLWGEGEVGRRLPPGALQPTTTCLLQNPQAAPGLLQGPLMRCGQVRRSFQKNDVCKVMLKTMLSSPRGMGLFRGFMLWFVKCWLWMKRVA